MATPAPAALLSGPTGSLHHRCASPDCSKTGHGLLRCAACKVVRYCTRDHQVGHRPQHKSICNTIKKLHRQLEHEDHLVRNAEPDFTTPANAFETDVGHFWGLLGTRDYMRARFALADETRRAGTLDGVSESLEHMRDMLRLCRSDNMGLRDIAPALMLQLDQDQDCYDFIKWWNTAGNDPEYDFGDTDIPHLDIEGADVLEDVGFLERDFGDLSHLAVALLLKLKLLIDIRNLKVARKVLRDRLPAELWQPVESAAVRSPLSRAFLGKSDEELLAIERRLLRQAMRLGSAIVKANPHFIHALLDPEDALSERPMSYSLGSYEEVQLTLYHIYPAWRETEGALDLLHQARANAAKDSEDEIGDIMESSTFKTSPGSDRTRSELLEDVSFNRIWGYLDWAVEDASALGPEKPSDRHRREIREALDDLEEESDESDASDIEF